MPTFIDLGKVPSNPEERQELIAKRINMEEFYSASEISYIQRMVIDFLVSKKGYTINDSYINREFTINLADVSFTTMADIAIKIEDKIIIVIKCVMNSLESWERHSMAFCRIVEPYQIPYAVITDGESVRILDVLSGEVVSGPMDLMPSREDLIKKLPQIVLCPFPREKCEKEKRVLYAFDAIKCSAKLSSSE